MAPPFHSLMITFLFYASLVFFGLIVLAAIVIVLWAWRDNRNERRAYERFPSPFPQKAHYVSGERTKDD